MTVYITDRVTFIGPYHVSLHGLVQNHADLSVSWLSMNDFICVSVLSVVIMMQ